MDRTVFLQSVGHQIDLDRRLRSGDALVVEARRVVRDGELVVADVDKAGTCVGRYRAETDELVMYPLEPGGMPTRLRHDALHVRGVVIGVRSAL